MTCEWFRWQEINDPFTGVAVADVSRMGRIVRSGGKERQ